ncbi:hypothetical protein OH76DRAFT_972531 [Lentinus brumalis]|uniref:Uncharacterized protein n=1 Tax=Lentinus brumalis TaxID=2498619 RepID=A0A371DPQ3_9APHY|nr:hypothetical protein OH76DRAFT_972531 [Polyporus brumalis]
MGPWYACFHDDHTRPRVNGLDALPLHGASSDPHLSVVQRSSPSQPGPVQRPARFHCVGGGHGRRTAKPFPLRAIASGTAVQGSTTATYCSVAEGAAYVTRRSRYATVLTRRRQDWRSWGQLLAFDRLLRMRPATLSNSSLGGRMISRTEDFLPVALCQTHVNAAGWGCSEAGGVKYGLRGQFSRGAPRPFSG